MACDAVLPLGDQGNRSPARWVLSNITTEPVLQKPGEEGAFRVSDVLTMQVLTALL